MQERRKQAGWKCHKKRKKKRGSTEKRSTNICKNLRSIKVHTLMLYLPQGLKKASFVIVKCIERKVPGVSDLFLYWVFQTLLVEPTLPYVYVSLGLR